MALVWKPEDKYLITKSKIKVHIQKVAVLLCKILYLASCLCVFKPSRTFPFIFQYFFFFPLSSILYASPCQSVKRCVTLVLAHIAFDLSLVSPIDSSAVVSHLCKIKYEQLQTGFSWSWVNRIGFTQIEILFLTVIVFHLLSTKTILA